MGAVLRDYRWALVRSGELGKAGHVLGSGFGERLGSGVGRFACDSI
jgi:hypothetical protein